MKRFQDARTGRRTSQRRLRIR